MPSSCFSRPTSLPSLALPPPYPPPFPPPLSRPSRPRASSLSPVPASWGCKGLWSYDYNHSRIEYTRPPTSARLATIIVYTLPSKTGRGQKDDVEKPLTPTPPDEGTATPAASAATAAPSATGISTMTARPAADQTIVAATSTATQTRVAIRIQIGAG